MLANSFGTPKITLVWIYFIISNTRTSTILYEYIYVVRNCTYYAGSGFQPGVLVSFVILWPKKLWHFAFIFMWLFWRINIKKMTPRQTKVTIFACTVHTLLITRTARVVLVDDQISRKMLRNTCKLYSDWQDWQIVTYCARNISLHTTYEYMPSQ